jgi:hypothetical protein
VNEAVTDAVAQLRRPTEALDPRKVAAEALNAACSVPWVLTEPLNEAVEAPVTLESVPMGLAAPPDWLKRSRRLMARCRTGRL